MLRVGSRLGGLIALVGWSACGFSVTATPGDGDIGDGDSGRDTFDSPPPVPRWVFVGVSRGGVASVEILPFDGMAFTSPCSGKASTLFASRDLIPNPSAPVVYGVESNFHSFTRTCATIASTNTTLGGIREIQQIAYDAPSRTGFFTGDGAAAIGVYRFTTAVDGAATINGMANATSNSGPIALDASARRLYTASTYGLVDEYVLANATLDLPAMRNQALGCVAPVRLLATGDKVLELCRDQGDIRRYTRSPITFEGTVGSIGMIAAATPLANDRAVAVRVSPPQLVVLDLNDGAPSFSDGPTIPGDATAVTSSDDGLAVATAHINGSGSEVRLWRVEGDTLSLVGATSIDGTVTALALSSPGT